LDLNNKQENNWDRLRRWMISFTNLFNKKKLTHPEKSKVKNIELGLRGEKNSRLVPNFEG
jgi:hypothetical protein